MRDDTLRRKTSGPSSKAFTGSTHTERERERRKGEARAGRKKQETQTKDANKSATMIPSLNGVNESWHTHLCVYDLCLLPSLPPAWRGWGVHLLRTERIGIAESTFVTESTFGTEGVEALMASSHGSKWASVSNSMISFLS